jgi:hypothetical protein
MTTTYTPQEILDKADNATTLEEVIEAIVLLGALIESVEQDLDTTGKMG